MQTNNNQVFTTFNDGDHVDDEYDCDCDSYDFDADEGDDAGLVG